MNINQTNKYVSYIRVSTDKQGDSGLGIEAQQKINRNYITSMQGELIKEEIEIETGTNKMRISSKTNLNLETLLEKRPILRDLIEYCKEQKATLVVKDLSRLGRSSLLIAYLMQVGIKFVCADSPKDDGFMLQIRAAMYEEEAKNISKRTIAALQAKKARGEKLGNPNIKNTPKPGNQIAYKTSLRYYLTYKPLILDFYSQKPSYTFVAKQMNLMGLKTINGACYTADTILEAIKRFKKAETSNDC